MSLPALDSLSERRVSLLVILFGLLVYIPFAGSYGLHDPWETHYSEVARQMTRRGDFISLWWPGSPRDVDAFWSKPVLSFWLMSIGMHVARAELTTAIGALVDRLPNLRLDPDAEPPKIIGMYERGPSHIPVVWH